MPLIRLFQKSLCISKTTRLRKSIYMPVSHYTFNIAKQGLPYLVKNNKRPLQDRSITKQRTGLRPSFIV